MRQLAIAKLRLPAIVFMLLLAGSRSHAASVTLSLPDGAKICDTMTVTARVTGFEDAGVQRVEFFVDGKSRGEDASIPYTFEWNTLEDAEGEHTLEAVATDRNGSVARASVRVVIDNELSLGAERHGVIALEALANKDTDTAQRHARRALKLDPTNLAAARRAAELGIPFVVATGRPLRWLDVLDELAEAHSQVVVSNGAAVVDLATRTVVRSFPLDAATAVEVASALRAAIPGTTFGFETPTGFGCEPGCPSVERASAGSVMADLDALAARIGPVIKLLGYHTRLDSDALAEQAARVVGDRLTQTHSVVAGAYGLLELSAPGVTKASTLALICAELGVGASDVIAFGDMPNDRAMLAWAGRGYVVANGHQSLLSAGFTVVPGNDADGVGRTVLDLLA